MRSKDWNNILAGLLLAPIPLVAHAETYLTESQAAAVLFPGIALEPHWVDLTPVEVKSIQKLSEARVPTPHVRVWRGANREALIIDRVLAKHESITYAVAIDSQGRVKGIEIMDYRETYGYQIRGQDWRRNFVGKSSRDPVRLDKDIPNISGATLSSKHVTDGVRRVLQTYEILKSKS